MAIALFFQVFVFTLPLVFFPKSSELFEFNKLIILYVFTVLIIATWVIKMVIAKKIIFQKTLLDWPLILFLGSQFLATILSIDFRTSLLGYYGRWNGSLLTTICYALLYWAFVSNITKKQTLSTIYCLLVSGSLVAIWGILEHFNISFSCLLMRGTITNSCWTQDVATRIFATFGQPNWLAAFVTALLPLTWHKTVKSKKRARIFYFVIANLFFACLLFTKSRSGLIAFGITSLIFWAFNLKNNTKLFLILSASYLILFILFNPWKVTSQPIPSGDNITESGDIRKIVWKGALEVFKHHPIFGTGVETFAYSYYEFRPVEHNLVSEWDFLFNKAHNEYLNFAATTGIIGLGSYLSVIFFAILQIIKKSNLAILCGFIAILITNFFGFSVITISLLFFLFPALATKLHETH